MEKITRRYKGQFRKLRFGGLFFSESAASILRVGGA